MPTRSLKLKLHIGRMESGQELRQALWTTHRIINHAVAEMERILLLCRGRSYVTLDENQEEIEIPENRVRADALQWARSIQTQNGFR